jgi:hypothetical protein
MHKCERRGKMAGKKTKKTNRAGGYITPKKQVRKRLDAADDWRKKKKK